MSTPEPTGWSNGFPAVLSERSHTRQPVIGSTDRSMIPGSPITVSSSTPRVNRASQPRPALTGFAVQDDGVETELDLAAYLRRIGFAGSAEPTLACLRDVHFAHAVSIPFENLDILLGRQIRLDLASLQAKLVTGGRGGYCFEHNSLLAAELETIGFTVTRLAARVRFGRREVGARSHMLLRVDADGRPWLADVGFGGSGLLQPMSFEPGPAVTQFGWTYRLVADGPERVLQTSEPGGWVDQYAFTLDPQHPIDYEVANHYTSTHPNSPFTRTLTVQRPQPGNPEVRVVVRGRKLIEYSPGGRSTSRRISDHDLLSVLAKRFGLVFPATTRFP